MSGRDPGGTHPARTSSDDKQVEIVFSHFLTSTSLASAL
jgi:hypothetical protein